MKTIALDIGNVCIDIHPEKFLHELALKKTTRIPDELMKSISDMETGLISENEWLTTLKKYTENKFSDHQLRKAYCSIIGEEKPGMENFLRKSISLNFRIIFFSDTSPIHINHIFRNLSFANLVSGGIYSYDAGCSKPDSRIYSFYEKRYGTPCIYIDDKKENIDAGKKAGWHSIMFESDKSLKTAFDLL